MAPQLPSCRRFLRRRLYPGVGVVALLLAAPWAAAETYSSSTPVTIPAVGAAAPYHTTILVSGGPLTPTAVTKVTVTLQGFSHTFPRDVDVLLVGPTGRTVFLMSDVGSGTD